MSGVVGATALAVIVGAGARVGASTKAGGEFPVSIPRAGNQVVPSVGMDVSGHFVVAWNSQDQDGSGFGVYARRFAVDGTPLGDEFRVNTYTTGDQLDAAVAVEPNGRFVIVWTSDGQDGSGQGIYGQRYDASGAPEGGEFRVNTYTTSTREAPAVAIDGAGRFAVVWQTDGPDGSGFGIDGQRYNASGAPLGGEFGVNRYTPLLQRNAAIAMDTNGHFVVTWNGSGQGDSSGVSARLFDHSGPEITLSGDIAVNTYTTGSQFLSAVGIDADGNFVVTWVSNGEDGSQTPSNGVFARLFDKSGTARADEFRVNAFTPNDQQAPSIAADNSGHFVIAWESYGQDSCCEFGVFARRYDHTGASQGGEFRVNTTISGNQRNPSVAIEGNGHFVVAWQSPNLENLLDIYGQQYTYSPSVTTTSPTLAPVVGSPVRDHGQGPPVEAGRRQGHSGRVTPSGR